MWQISCEWSTSIDYGTPGVAKKWPRVRPIGCKWLAQSKIQSHALIKRTENKSNLIVTWWRSYEMSNAVRKVFYVSICETNCRVWNFMTKSYFELFFLLNASSEKQLPSQNMGGFPNSNLQCPSAHLFTLIESAKAELFASRLCTSVTSKNAVSQKMIIMFANKRGEKEMIKY